MLPDLHIGFSRGRSGGLVFPFLEEFSTVCCDPHKGFRIVNKAEVDVFMELSCLFNDPVIFENQLEHLEVHGSHTVEAWLGLYAGQEATIVPDMEQWAGSKWGKEYIKAVYCHPAYLTSMQSTSC